MGICVVLDVNSDARIKLRRIIKDLNSRSIEKGHMLDITELTK